MTAPETFEQALATARSWMGSLPGVVAVGEGEEGGERTIDVWVTGVPDVQLPQDLAPFRVRIRPSGGPIHALETEEADPDKPTAR